MSKKILYFDCFAGISGDMAVGALLDIINVDDFRSELSKLKLEDYDVKIENVLKSGIKGTSFFVYDYFNKKTHAHEHNVEHVHHEHHSHSHHHDHEQENKYGHSHSRNFADIEKIINESGLKESVKAMSLKIFNIIGEAEAKVHNKSINEIHFHEVGAIDSIIDIVSFSICYDILKPDIVKSSPVNLGNGFVKCAHGLLPVPAPAVMEISEGIPVYKSDVDGELTTPTGIAILKAITNEFTSNIKLVPEKTGYGAGKKEYPFPNLLRVISGLETEM